MMRRIRILTAVTSVMFATTVAVADESWSFENAQVGMAPAGWITDVTGAQQGKAPRWQVIRDDGRNVLAQLESGGANGDFPVCLKQGSSFKDGTVSVLFKSISGRVDQAGGVVFRAMDKDNFYIARANALENNVSFYVTRNGKRKTIKYWDDIKVGLGEWHDLKVEVTGFTFSVSLDNKFVGEVEDTEATFSSSGKVGVWTKADSVTYFEELSVTLPKPHR